MLLFSDVGFSVWGLGFSVQQKARVWDLGREDQVWCFTLFFRRFRV